MQTEYKPNLCVQCNLSFKMTKDHKTHMLQHGVKKSHSCNQCCYSTIKAADLKRHTLVPYILKASSQSSQKPPIDLHFPPKKYANNAEIRYVLWV